MTSISHPRPPRTMGEPSPGLVVAPVLRTGAGTPLPVQVTVVNHADAPRVVHLHALGLDPAWLPEPIVTPLLAPGESHTATLVLSPVAGTLPAQYPFVVSAQAVDAMGQPTQARPALAETMLLVNPRAQLRLELLPSSVTAWRSRRLTLRVTNAGGGSADVRLQPQTTGSVRFRLARTALEIPGGGVVDVKARATLRHPQLLGMRMRHVLRVEATGSEASKYVDGELIQRPLVPPFWLKLVALLAALAVWVSAGLVLLPKVTDLFGGNNSATTVSSQQQPGAAGAGADGTGGAGGAAGAGGASSPGSSSKGGSPDKAAAAAAAAGIQLTGTIKSDAPGGVTVSLRRTALVDESALGATPVGVDQAALDSTAGKLMPAAYTTVLPAHEPTTRSFTSRSDGIWSFPGVKAPGYYLLTFDKAGYIPQAFVIDTSSAAAAQPLEVDLAPGDGEVTGSISAHGHALGGATITVSDGVSTASTTTLTTGGGVGTFDVKNLATPGTYVVTATKNGLSLESTTVTLGAGGSAHVALGLRAGVATLSGHITGGDITAHGGRLGGATITVTDGSGHAYTATSETSSEQARPIAALRDSTEGDYHVPGLPAPGDYTVTVTADGYQTLTRALTLTEGEGERTLNLDLVPSTGHVVGQVTDDATPPVGLPDAGMVLSNSDHVYKQTSTTATKAGRDIPGYIEFDGVAPGTYQLTTQLFGYSTDTSTVVVRAGRDASVYPKLTFQPVAEITAEGHITGLALDADTNQPIQCAAGDPQCLHAETTDPCPYNEPTCAPGGADDWQTVFGPAEQFTLPHEAGKGLRPGIHTVTVGAPGYESTSSQVAVPAGGTVQMPTVLLFPAPTITGTVTVGDGATLTNAICVYAYSPGATVPTDCGKDIADGTCTASPASYLGTGATTDQVCAIPSSNGSYRIQVPKHGGWQVAVLTSAAHYLAPQAVHLELPQGGTLNHDFTLNRQGSAVITLKVPGAGGIPVPAEGGETWTLTDSASTQVASGTASGSGIVTIDNDLPPGTYTLQADGDEGKSAHRTVTLQYNQRTTGSLILTKVLDKLAGQVTATFETGEVKQIQGATVRITGPNSYDVNEVPQQDAATVTTGSGGCFAGLPGGDTLTEAQIDAIVAVPAVCGPQSTWIESGVRHVTPIDFISDTATRVDVSAPGYDPATLTNLAWNALPVAFTLSPQRISWSGLALQLPHGPTAGGLPSGLAFTITGKPGGGKPDKAMSGITLVPGTPAGGAVPLTWKDGSNADNTFGPGTYALTATAPGYEEADATLVCTVGASCTLSDWTLQKLGSLTITVRGQTASGTSPLQSAAVTVSPCTVADCSATGPVAYSGTTDDKGTLTILTMRPATDGSVGGAYVVSASASTYTGATNSSVTLADPWSDATTAFTLAQKHVMFQIAITDKTGAAVPGLTVQLLGVGDPITLSEDPSTAGTYASSDVPPANGYDLRISGHLIETTDLDVDVHASDSSDVLLPTNSISTSVARGASRVYGTVSSTGVPGATASVPIAKAHVVLTCDPGTTPPEPRLCPASGPALGVDGNKLEMNTGSGGGYSFNNVPDGTYDVTVTLAGWSAVPIDPIVTAWSLAALPAQNISMTPVTQSVTLTLDPSTTGEDLSQFSATLTPTETTYGQGPLTTSKLVDGSVTVPNVPRGCYTVTFSLPAQHFGTTAFSSQTAGLDTGSTCATLSVSTTPTTDSDDHSAAATYSLTEGLLSTTVTVGDHWHDAPLNAAVTISGSGSVHPPVQHVTVGTASEVWVPGGTWSLSASAEAAGGYTYPSAFWPAATSGAVTVSSSTGYTASLELDESTAAVTIVVPNAPNGTQLTVAATGTYPPTLTDAQKTLTTGTGKLADDTAVVALPGSSYTVTVTPPTGYQADSGSFTVATTGAKTVTLDPLQKTTHQVTVSVDPSAASDDLTNWSVSITGDDGTTTDPVALTVADDTTGVGTASFTVPWGCYTVTFTAPTNHAGTPSLSSSSGSCANGEVEVATTGATTADFDLQESAVAISAVLGPNANGTPTNATVRVRKPPTSSPTVATLTLKFGGASGTVWLPDGNWVLVTSATGETTVRPQITMPVASTTVTVGP